MKPPQNLRVAACSCQNIRLTCNGDPVRVSMCHCTECQRRTGSPFGVQARYPLADVDVQGEAKTYTRTGDTGASMIFHFCANCGSTVYWMYDEWIIIAAGAFADPTLPAPTLSVYHDRRHPWCLTPEGMIEETW